MADEELAPAAIQIPDAQPLSTAPARSPMLVVALGADQGDALDAGGRFLAFNIERLMVTRGARSGEYNVQSAAVAIDHVTKERQLLICLEDKR